MRINKKIYIVNEIEKEEIFRENSSQSKVRSVTSNWRRILLKKERNVVLLRLLEDFLKVFILEINIDKEQIMI